MQTPFKPFMNTQTLTIGKRRFVLLAERDFQRLQKKAVASDVRPAFAHTKKTGKRPHGPTSSESWDFRVACKVVGFGKEERQRKSGWIGNFNITL